MAQRNWTTVPVHVRIAFKRIPIVSAYSRVAVSQGGNFYAISEPSGLIKVYGVLTNTLLWQVKTHNRGSMTERADTMRFAPHVAIDDYCRLFVMLYSQKRARARLYVIADAKRYAVLELPLFEHVEFVSCKLDVACISGTKAQQRFTMHVPLSHGRPRVFLDGDQSLTHSVSAACSTSVVIVDSAGFVKHRDLFAHTQTILAKRQNIVGCALSSSDGALAVVSQSECSTNVMLKYPRTTMECTYRLKLAIHGCAFNQDGILVVLTDSSAEECAAARTAL